MTEDNDQHIKHPPTLNTDAIDQARKKMDDLIKRYPQPMIIHGLGPISARLAKVMEQVFSPCHMGTDPHQFPDDHVIFNGQKLTLDEWNDFVNSAIPAPPRPIMFPGQLGSFHGRMIKKDLD